MSPKSSRLSVLMIVSIAILFASAESQGQQANQQFQGKGSVLTQSGGLGPYYGNEVGSNIWYGEGAGTSITTGIYNSFFGQNAGNKTSGGANPWDGSYNSFFGNSAGSNNTTGYGNSFLGSYAGFFNTTGAGNSFFGQNAGYSNSTGYANSFVGERAGHYNATGNFNSFVGSNAGQSNTTGSFNSFLGAYAGNFNTTGFQNSFFGYSAGYSNTTGYYNSFFGKDAGTSNTTGYNNSIFGLMAGFSNIEGGANSFFGTYAGKDNSSGNYNSFFGESAGISNTTGYWNAFFGGGAAYYNTTGYSNSIFGLGAGYSNTTASYNSFFGKYAGFSNTTGRFNSIFGAEAGSSNTVEHNNSFVGSYSDGAAGITNATALGYRAKVTQSNSLVLGSINGVNEATADAKVGIGTTAPVSTLNIRSLTNVSPRGVTNEQYNDGMDGVQFRGRKARGNSTTPAAVQAGDVLGNYVFDAHDGTAFGTGVQIRPVTEEAWTSTAHGAYLALWTTPPGTTTNLERLRITGAGNVGIGMTNPVEKLHVNGSIRATGSIYSQPSPGMEVPDYVFESDYNLMPIGELEKFIASEKHLPNVPKTAEIRENGLNHTEFQMKLLEKIEELTLYTVQQAKLIQEAQATNEKHKSALERKDAEIASLNARLEALERMAKQEK